MYHFTLKSRRRETNPNHKKEHEQIPGISISFLPQLLTKKSTAFTLKPSDTHLLSLSWRSSFAASDSLECEITNTPKKTKKTSTICTIWVFPWKMVPRKHPKFCSFLVGKTHGFVGETHHFRKPLYKYFLLFVHQARCICVFFDFFGFHGVQSRTQVGCSFGPGESKSW